MNNNNYKKFIIKNRNIQPNKCRRCHARSVTIQYIILGCTYLANTDCLNRHNQVCNILHQKLVNKYGLLNTYTPYYKYQARAVLEYIRLYYNRSIITDRQVTNNRPDIVVVDKGTNSVVLVDVAVSKNNNLVKKWQEKKAK